MSKTEEQFWISVYLLCLKKDFSIEGARKEANIAVEMLRKSNSELWPE